MPGIMQQADLAISSAGRTITELTCLGIPVICLCQNEKELTHTHASAQFGVVNLGLGSLVDIKTISEHINHLNKSSELRLKLRNRALHETSNRNNKKIIQKILRKIDWHTTQHN